MISKKELQYYSSLLTKRHRKSENKFLVEGEKSVLEGLKSKYECEVIFVTHKFSEEHKEIFDQIKRTKHRFITLKQKEFEKISDTKAPQGIAAVFVKPELKFSFDSFKKDKIIVMLDNISDPGNLGTIFRNCDWFGVKTVLLRENIVEYTNPKVIRASMGSIFHLNIFEHISYKHLEKLKLSGFEILCSDIDGENVFTYKRESKKVLVLSSESHGPSTEIESISDKKICIPRVGNAESLNVASASAVLLAQLTK
jgi:TrmH family RNA methyltransferase